MVGLRLTPNWALISTSNASTNLFIPFCLPLPPTTGQKEVYRQKESGHISIGEPQSAGSALRRRNGPSACAGSDFGTRQGRSSLLRKCNASVQFRWPGKQWFFFSRVFQTKSMLDTTWCWNLKWKNMLIFFLNFVERITFRLKVLPDRFVQNDHIW